MSSPIRQKRPKETYKDPTSKKAERAKVPARTVLAHSYVRKDSRTMSEIKQGLLS